MRNGSLVYVVMVAASVVAAVPALTSAATTTRHAGTVETINPMARTLVVREYGANARAYDLRVRVAPDARVVLSERNPGASDAQHEFTTTPIRLSEIRRGDFVVLDLMGHGAQAVSESVMVTLRAGAAAEDGGGQRAHGATS